MKIIMCLLLLINNVFAGSLCNDGTYSNSEGRGTCSWHGGVDNYYYYGYHQKDQEKFSLDKLEIYNSIITENRLSNYTCGYKFSEEKYKNYHGFKIVSTVVSIDKLAGETFKELAIGSVSQVNYNNNIIYNGMDKNREALILIDYPDKFAALVSFISFEDFSFLSYKLYKSKEISLMDYHLLQAICIDEMNLFSDHPKMSE